MRRVRGWIAGGLVVMLGFIAADDMLERGEYTFLAGALVAAALVGYLVHRSD